MNLLLRISCILGLAACAMGVDYTFTGAQSSDWLDNRNWVVKGTSIVPNVGVIPDLTSEVNIPSGRTVSIADPGGTDHESEILAKTIICLGTIDLTTGTGATTLIVDGDITLTSGTIRLGSATVTDSSGLVANLKLNSSTAKFQGSGTVVVGGASAIRKSGILIASGGSLSIESGVTLRGGVLTLGLTVPSSILPGELVISSGANLNFSANGQLSSEKVNVTNKGTITLADGAQLALVNVDFLQNSTGILNVTIGSNSVSQAFIDQANNVDLAGTLNATLDPSFEPAFDTDFPITSKVSHGTNFTTFTSQPVGILKTPAVSVDTGALVVTYAAKQQSVFFPTISQTLVAGGSNFVMTATSSQSASISYSIAWIENPDGTTSSSPSATVVSTNTLHPGTVPETIRITATAASVTNANGTFARETAEQDVVIHQAQNITVSSIPTGLKTGDSFTLTATPNPATFLGTPIAATWTTSSNTAVATVSSAGLVNIVGLGTSTLTVTTPAVAPYLLAGTKSVTLTTALPQTVSITAPTSPASLPFSVTPTTVTASHQSTSTAGTWSSSNTAVATVGTFTDAAGVATAKITYVSLGTTTITFTSPADATFLQGTATLSLTVTQNTVPIASTVTFPALSSTINFGGPDVLMTATSNRGLVVNYGITLLDSLDSSTLSSTLSGATGATLRPGLKAETLRVTATSVAGTSPLDGLLYAADSKSQDVVIHKPQVLTISGVPTNFNVGESYTLVATPSVPTFNGTTVPVTWSGSSDTSVATINAAGVLTVLGNGTTTLTVGSPSIGTYLSQGNASVTITTTPVIAKPTSDGAAGGGGGCGSGGGVAVLLGGLALALRSRSRRQR